MKKIIIFLFLGGIFNYSYFMQQEALSHRKKKTNLQAFTWKRTKPLKLNPSITKSKHRKKTHQKKSLFKTRIHNHFSHLADEYSDLLNLGFYNLNSKEKKFVYDYFIQVSLPQILLKQFYQYESSIKENVYIILEQFFLSIKESSKIYMINNIERNLNFLRMLFRIIISTSKDVKKEELNFLGPYYIVIKKELNSCKDTSSGRVCSNKFTFEFTVYDYYRFTLNKSFTNFMFKFLKYIFGGYEATILKEEKLFGELKQPSTYVGCNSFFYALEVAI